MFAIYKKEMRSYFTNPIGYIFVGIFLFTLNFILNFITNRSMKKERADANKIQSA